MLLESSLLFACASAERPATLAEGGTDGALGGCGAGSLALEEDDLDEDDVGRGSASVVTLTSIAGTGGLGVGLTAAILFILLLKYSEVSTAVSAEDGPLERQ